MTAETIAKALGGRKAGGDWMARCPVHDDREPSLSIRDADDGKVLVRCHAGCDQQKVIVALRARGIWQRTDRRHGVLIRPQPSRAAKNEPDRDDAERMALRLWGASVPATGTLVETYLHSRGIVTPITATVRFRAGLKHPRGDIWPAMVALVTRGRDDTPLAIHRTFMSGDGTSKAPIEPAKMMLGPCRGGAVRLGPITDRLLVAEGIENAFSAMQATGQAAWAALSASGLRALELPVEVRDVVVLADGDEPGERQRTTRRGAGNEEGGAFASPVHRVGLISTTCFWAAPSATWRERRDLRNREPDRQRDRERRGNSRFETLGQKPRLLIEDCNPDRTVAALRDTLSAAGGLYDRGVPVRLAFDQIQRGTVAQVMTPDALVLMAHAVCWPYVLKAKRDGTVSEVNARLPRSFAVMYLDWRGKWRLAPLNGIASAPLLQDDGTINSAEGHDPVSGMWCENVPNLAGLVSARPTKDDAAAALRLIREIFKTFCFADAETMDDAAGGVATVDTSKAPGRDESSFLVALLTAVCRPSLHLAPGVLLRAPPMSGAGAGKGLLARCICIIAFGREPHAVTAGATAEELEKRIAAELIEGSPALFLDNLNNTAFKSNLLASAITERPARVRLLGKSQMVPLNASAFVILTGNGLTLSEDLARRFVAVDFDPRPEDPEARPFTTDIRVEVTDRRTELLAALLTIWRWGRVATDIKPGLALGSFAQWCRWVRDPLLALGCQDPAERVSEAKERDGRRQAVADLFATWWEKHHDLPIAVRQLHDDVKQAADPQGRGRQHLASQLEKLAGTRIAGFVLSRQAPAGKWGVATYALKKTGGGENHRDHRGLRAEAQPLQQADTPDAPYADGKRGANGHAAEASDAPMAPMPPKGLIITDVTHHKFALACHPQPENGGRAHHDQPDVAIPLR